MIIYFLTFIATVRSLLVRGSLPLDSLTFEKVIRNHEWVLVKFDTAYPFGDLHDEWKDVARYSARNIDLIAAEVNINEYGDRENQDIGFKFDISKEDYPVYKLFNRDPMPTASIPYEGEGKTRRDILAWMKQNGVYVGLPTCIEVFDDLAHKFIKNEAKRSSTISLAENEASKIENETKRKYAEVYVKVMKRIQEKGIKWVDSELRRIEKNLEDKSIKDDLKTNMRSRQNILESFKFPTPPRHDEL